MRRDFEQKMQIKKLPVEFEEALPILKQIRQAGFEAYFVGGCVRDTLLGLPIHDIDIATSAYPEEIKQIFSKTVDTGIEHGTVMVLDHGIGYEITTFRTESGYQDFRRPDKVEFVRSLAEDLKRRDLTINALALAPDGQIIDLFGGLEDLKAKRIKAVSDAKERFFEDALRMMRAVRFASQLDFSIEVNTLQAIQQNAHLLEKIAVERIHVEWIKLLLGKQPKCGLEAFVTTRLFEYCPGFAPHAQALADLSKLELELTTEAQCWGLLGYSFKLNEKQLRKLLKAWKTSNEIIAQAQHILNLLQIYSTGKKDIWACYQAKSEAVSAVAQLATLLAFPAFDAADFMQAYAQLAIKDKSQLAVNGKLLIKEAKLTPGPLLGKILNILEREVVLGEISNQKEALLTRAKNLR